MTVEANRLSAVSLSWPGTASAHRRGRSEPAGQGATAHRCCGAVGGGTRGPATAAWPRTSARPATQTRLPRARLMLGTALAVGAA